jgi:hypothetical protein
MRKMFNVECLELKFYIHEMDYRFYLAVSDT